MKTRQTGQHAEMMALKYLIKQGLKPVINNYSCRLGEIDLIMRDKEYLIFIEVRLRSESAYGDGAASITYAKQQKIMKTASHYMIQHQIYGKNPLRFDVISIEGNTGAITWLKNAFGVDY